MKDRWHCSNCGHRFPSELERPFCPSCGNTAFLRLTPDGDDETLLALQEHARQQQQVMLEGVRKKDRHWTDLDPEDIRDHMWNEVVELYRAFEAGDNQKLTKAAADVSNYAMMLSWK